MKVSKKRYLQTFGVVTVVLSLVRCIYPEVALSRSEMEAASQQYADSIVMTDTMTYVDIPDEPKHPIYSVRRFQESFPDSQQVHLECAERLGVSPVLDRRDAEQRKKELVYVGANPYFYVEDLKNSVPYLVPKASTLLNDIGRSYYDSLYVKGIPLHKLIVTSVLRTKEDVERLRVRNHNATENSCHLYGTTFDLSQNRYKTVQRPGENRRVVSNDTLKWVLSEVLRDFREQGRCYIKYEVKQGCFHITVR